MSFTHRHYNEVARIIREEKARHQHSDSTGPIPDQYERVPYEAVERVQEGLRRMFAADNPRFDTTRFDMACEPKEGQR